jgi:hypothetical protein
LAREDTSQGTERFLKEEVKRPALRPFDEAQGDTHAPRQVPVLTNLKQLR